MYGLSYGSYCATVLELFFLIQGYTLCVSISNTVVCFVITMKDIICKPATIYGQVKAII